MLGRWRWTRAFPAFPDFCNLPRVVAVSAVVLHERSGVRRHASAAYEARDMAVRATEPGRQEQVKRYLVDDRSEGFLPTRHSFRPRHRLHCIGLPAAPSSHSEAISRQECRSTAPDQRPAVWDVAHLGAVQAAAVAPVPISSSWRRYPVSNAATTCGSNSVPDPLVMISRASAGSMPLRYGRSLVNES